jgi:hypothetical protein
VVQAERGRAATVEVTSVATPGAEAFRRCARRRCRHESLNRACRHPELVRDLSRGLSFGGALGDGAHDDVRAAEAASPVGDRDVEGQEVGEGNHRLRYSMGATPLCTRGRGHASGYAVDQIAERPVSAVARHRARRAFAQSLARTAKVVEPLRSADAKVSVHAGKL